MKIALVDPVGAKMGMNHYDDGLLNALAGIGFETLLLSNYKSRFENIHSHIFFSTSEKLKLHVATATLVGTIRALVFCKKQKVNYIIFHIFKGGILDLVSLSIAKLLRVKILLIVHDIKTIDSKEPEFIKRIVLKKFHSLMVVHNAFSHEQLKIFLKTDLENCFVIPHGNFIHAIDNSVTRTAAVEYFKLDKNKKYLLFFGQIKKTKGLEVLLEAMKFSNNDWYLVIAGKLRINSFRHYQKIISDLDLQNRITIFLKHISDIELFKLLALSEAVILPYKIIYQSGVMITAMSFGKTVIASDIPAFKETIRHGENGLLFKANDAKDLAFQTDQFLRGAFDKKAMEHNSRKIMQQGFEWKNIASQYALLFRKT